MRMQACPVFTLNERKDPRVFAAIPVTTKPGEDQERRFAAYYDGRTTVPMVKNVPANSVYEQSADAAGQLDAFLDLATKEFKRHETEYTKQLQEPEILAMLTHRPSEYFFSAAEVFGEIMPVTPVAQRALRAAGETQKQATHNEGQQDQPTLKCPQLCDTTVVCTLLPAAVPVRIRGTASIFFWCLFYGMYGCSAQSAED
jgi:hypothetical protein